tara:strand:+ start:349 stop:585 length:237 start_codon:yes stop_codon:yes gene_type:complete
LKKFKLGRDAFSKLRNENRFITIGEFFGATRCDHNIALEKIQTWVRCFFKVTPESGAGGRQFFWTWSQDFWRSGRDTF